MFYRKVAYDRQKILDAAARARSRRRYRRAIELYRRVLAVEPRDVDLHMRIAPLLAATHQHFDAWASFEHCARTAIAEQNLDRAATIYREATRCMPRHFEAWSALASIEKRRGRQQAAFDALLEGRQRFRGRSGRPQAIALLRRARGFEACSPKLIRDLARLLAAQRQRGEAQQLLEQLAQRVTGIELRRTRAAQWRMSPTLGATWRLLRAAAACMRSESDDWSDAVAR